MGTCWWSIFNFYFYITLIESTLLKLSVVNNNTPFFFINLNFLFEYFNNLILIYFLYFFFKLVLISSIVELIWPTHFFNKKNSIYNIKTRNRFFLEFFLKTFKKNSNITIFNITLINFFLK